MSVWRKEAHPSLLPWLAADLLSAPEALEVKDHVARCKPCADVAATIAAMSATLRAAAAEHIGVEEMVEWEGGRIHGDAARSARIEVHLAACADCRDDLAALEGRSAQETAARTPPRFTAISRTAALSAAAGILLGIGLGAAIWRSKGEPNEADGRSESSWAGPTVLVLLPRPQRGGESPTLMHRIGGEERVVFAFPSLDSGFQDQEGLYRFEISGDSLGGVLSQSMSGSDARRHLDAARVITFDLPADRLPPGRYSCRVIASGGALLYDASVEVVTGD